MTRLILVAVLTFASIASADAFPWDGATTLTDAKGQTLVWTIQRIDGVVRIITRDGSQKVRNIERDGRATVAQLSGPQWLSIAGTGVIERDADAVAHAVSLYAARYRQPKPNPLRVVIRITPDKTLGSAGLWS